MATQNNPINNPLRGCALEFHILQSFPVTCLNRDDVGAPKSAIVGGVQRARVSSQCWKRAVRMALRDFCDVRIGIRTRDLKGLLEEAFRKEGATDEKKYKACAASIQKILTSKEKSKDDTEDKNGNEDGNTSDEKATLIFISHSQISALAKYAKQNDFKKITATAKKKPPEELVQCLKENYKANDGIDIALFGRMLAQAPTANVHAAASFAHAISTHKATNEVEFFTALDDNEPCTGSAHMGTLEYNSATYYRYISLDLGQLWENLGGEGIENAVETFITALSIAVPAARQNTQSGACLWNYARVLLRKGPRMQVSFEKPVVKYKDEGWLDPSIKELNAAIARHERLYDDEKLYGKLGDFAFGADKGQLGISGVRKGVKDALTKLLAKQEQA